MASSTKLWAGPQLLTKSSWDPGQLTSARRIANRDLLPRRDMWHTWDDAPAVHPGNRAAGMKEAIRRTSPGSVNSPSTWGPELLRPVRAQNTGPTESAPLWSTREPEPEWLRPGKCTHPRARCRQFPCRATWSLSSVDRESTRRERGQTQCGPDTASPPHTRQWCLLAAFLPTAQLNKWA